MQNETRKQQRVVDCGGTLQATERQHRYQGKEVHTFFLEQPYQKMAQEQRIRIRTQCVTVRCIQYKSRSL